MRWAILLCLWPFTASADPPMTGAAFDAYSVGKTMTYARDRQVLGREQYLPGHKVIWAFEGNAGKTGSWFEEAGGMICLAYEGDSDAPECWWFYQATWA